MTGLSDLELMRRLLRARAPQYLVAEVYRRLDEWQYVSNGFWALTGISPTREEIDMLFAEMDRQIAEEAAAQRDLR